ncbi:hypothetical protein [Kitasatospora azatica]|nr:hypothetical protein [Kitasatospora azatica]
MRLKKFVRSVPGQFTIALLACLAIWYGVAEIAPWIMLHIFLHGGF